MRATIFGAGNIGRGLVGLVLSRGGFDVTFVDANTDLVERLGAAGSYTVHAGDAQDTVAISGILPADDLDAVTAAVATSDVIATAVGERVLQFVAPGIAAGLAERQVAHPNVLACENIHPNSALLAEHVATHVDGAVLEGVGFPNVVVDRIVPGDPNEIDVVAEAGFEFVVDATAWAGEPLDGSEIVFASDLGAYKLRKLWLVNGLHVLAAWMGIRAGVDYVHEAVANATIRASLESAAGSMVEVLAGMTDEFTALDLEAYAASSLTRFENDELPDLVARVARNPLQKLGADERVMGPARRAELAGLAIDGFADGIAAALQLADDRVDGIGDLTDAVDRHGEEGLLVSHGGAAADGQLIDAVAAVRQRAERRTETMVTEEIVIENPAGLHARPAAEIVERAKAFEATIEIKKGDKVASAASIMSVLALGASTGDTVTVSANGEGAAEAVAAMREIMQAAEH